MSASRRRARAVATPSGLVLRRSEPTRCSASRSRSSAAAAVTKPPGLLGGGVGGGDLHPLLAQPRRGAEHRLVDAEVKAPRTDCSPNPEVLGDVAATQLLHLGLGPVVLEALGHPESASAIEPIDEGPPVALRGPGKPARPIAPIPRPPRAARVDAVEGGADGAVDRRLAGLVRPQHHGEPLAELEPPMPQRSEAGDLQPLQPHRSPTSLPAKASNP